jgi:hypothetical protein
LGDRGHLQRGPTPDIRVHQEIAPLLLELGVARAVSSGASAHPPRGPRSPIFFSAHHRKKEFATSPKSLDSPKANNDSELPPESFFSGKI